MRSCFVPFYFTVYLLIKSICFPSLTTSRHCNAQLMRFRNSTVQKVPVPEKMPRGRNMAGRECTTVRQTATQMWQGMNNRSKNAPPLCATMKMIFSKNVPMQACQEGRTRRGNMHRGGIAPRLVFPASRMQRLSTHRITA